MAAALLLTCCQQNQYPGNPEYKEYTKSDLALLQLGTRSAATGEVHCRFETTQAGEEETQRYPLTAEELVLLKNCLSKVTPAPRSTPEALSCRWKTASIEIRLLTINGRTLCAISPNTICSYSDSLSRGNTLLCLPDTEMGVLRALPTVQMAKEAAEAARRYVQHYRLRTERAAELRAAAEQAASAEVELKLDEHKEKLTDMLNACSYELSRCGITYVNADLEVHKTEKFTYGNDDAEEADVERTGKGTVN